MSRPRSARVVDGLAQIWPSLARYVFRQFIQRYRWLLSGTDGAETSSCPPVARFVAFSIEVFLSNPRPLSVFWSVEYEFLFGTLTPPARLIRRHRLHDFRDRRFEHTGRVVHHPPGDPKRLANGIAGWSDRVWHACHKRFTTICSRSARCLPSLRGRRLLVVECARFRRRQTGHGLG